MLYAISTRRRTGQSLVDLKILHKVKVYLVLQAISRLIKRF